MNLLAAELRKATSTRLMWVLLAGLVAFVALNVVATVLASGQAATGLPPLDTAEAVKSVWTSAGSGGLLALVIGILGITGEYRHQTITGTFLTTPRRSRVLVPKMAAHALIGLGYGLAAAVTALLLAPPLLGLRDAAALPFTDVAGILAGAVAGTALYGVLGVAVGALIRNQIAAVVGALIWVLLVEGLLVAFLPEVGRWLPGGAANAMLQAETLRGDLLSPAVGALLMLGYAAALGWLATRVTLRADVT
jgi:ABC-type transport system involved in multi-copper enzyme maturation permease subunit